MPALDRHVSLPILPMSWLSLFALLSVFNPWSLGEAQLRGPWSEGRVHSERSNTSSEMSHSSALRTALTTSPGSFFGFYHRVLSSIDGRDCPCYPSCSAYAITAVQKHGPFLGTLFAIDRLIREADEINSKSPILTPSGWKFYDPLWQNDFWFTPSPHPVNEEVRPDLEEESHQDREITRPFAMRKGQRSGS